jgi:hypothetical protein
MLFLAFVLMVLSLTACGAHEKANPIPPVGRKLVRVALETGSPLKVGREGSGFGDTCANVLRDSTTGLEYLLVRSTVATARSRTATIDSGTVLSAVGYYASVVIDKPGVLPKVDFEVDCSKSRVMTVFPAPNTR